MFADGGSTDSGPSDGGDGGKIAFSAMTIAADVEGLSARGGDGGGRTPNTAGGDGGSGGTIYLQGETLEDVGFDGLMANAGNGWPGGKGQGQAPRAPGTNGLNGLPGGSGGDGGAILLTFTNSVQPNLLISAIGGHGGLGGMGEEGAPGANGANPGIGGGRGGNGGKGSVGGNGGAPGAITINQTASSNVSLIGEGVGAMGGTGGNGATGGTGSSNANGGNGGNGGTGGNGGNGEQGGAAGQPGAGGTGGAAGSSNNTSGASGNNGGSGSAGTQVVLPAASLPGPPKVDNLDGCQVWAAGSVGSSGPPTTAVSCQQFLVTVIGQTVAFSVDLAGTLPIYYQWYQNGVPISGGVNSLLIFNAGTNSSGQYSVVASNTSGSMTISNMTLTVMQSPFIQTQPQNQSVPRRIECRV